MIDINRDDFYKYNEDKEKTKERLIEISSLGMEEVGIAQFGIKNILSGLYIERVWSYSDAEWTDYIKWVKNLLIVKNKPSKNEKK